VRSVSVITGIVLLACTLLYSQNIYENHTINHDVCSMPIKAICFKTGTSINTLPTYDETTSTSLYIFLSERLLILSSDVELNPGPSAETQSILDAIAASNIKTSKEIYEVKHEILSVKSEIVSVKNELNTRKIRYC
jgi:hypothetical protein